MQSFLFPNENIPAGERAVALGFFDGLHLGHRAVLQALFQVAGDRLCPTVLTFDTLPKMQGVDRLINAEEADRLLDRAGVAERVTVQIGAVSELSPEDFVRQVLIDTLGARAVVCGYNYRFGEGAVGDAALLCRLGEQYGVRVVVVPAVTADDAEISTTRIRAAVSAGDFAVANRLLGRPYVICAPVESGRHLGRNLGAPTINQSLPQGCVLPKFGVYVSAVLVNGKVTYGVTDIGVKPTVGSTRPLAETWIPAFEGDLYGQAVPVMPIAFLRPEETFCSIAELQKQIMQDGETARCLMTQPTGRLRAVLFDFDDTLQNRTLAFSAFSRDFLKRHFPQWDTEQLERNAHRMTELNCGGNELGYPAFFEVIRREFGGFEGMDGQSFLTEVQREFPFYTTLLSGAAETVAQLRRHGYRIGMVTNGYSITQNRKLDVSGLRPLFDNITVAGDEGVSKPEGEIFRRAAAYLGVPPEDCVFVGDHPQNDIAGAKAVGMHPVFMAASGCYRSPEDDTVPVIHTPEQLLSLLERL